MKDLRVFPTPVSKEEVAKAFSYTARSEEDRLLFHVLDMLATQQEALDERLSELSPTTLDHGIRFALRSYGYVTFNKDLKKWYVFNGRFCQEAPRWFLIKIVDLVSKGLARESLHVGKITQKDIETLCTEIGVSAASLKGKSRKDKVEALKKELLTRVASGEVAHEKFPSLFQALEKLTTKVASASTLEYESRHIRDGKGPLTLLEQASCTYGIEHTSADYDKDGLLVVVQNGTLDLRNLDAPDHLLRPSHPEDLNTLCMNVVYDPTAKAPLVEEQLKWVFLQPDIDSEDTQEAMLRYARMLFGGVLDGTRTKGTFLILSGIPGSGKSIILGALSDVMGSYAVHVDGNFFLYNPNRGKGDATPHLAKVVNKRLVIASEVPEAASKLMDEKLVKEWTGGDMLSYRGLYSEEKTFKPNGQLVMSTNELPRLSGDRAVGDRHRLAVHHCSRTVPETKRRDEDLFRKELLQEGSGFLNILLQGLKERNSVTGRITPPVSILHRTSDYVNSQDEIALFVEEHKIQANPLSETYGVSSEELYTAYVAYKGAGSTDLLSMKMFTTKLEGRGFQKKRTAKGVVWKGIFLPKEEKTPVKKDVRLPDTIVSSNGHKVETPLDLTLENL